MGFSAIVVGRHLAVASLALAVLAQCSPGIGAGANGALAIGLPKDVTRFGFAAGSRLNAPDADTASKDALAACQKSISASDTAKKLCKVVASFHNQCFAIAIDPETGTPGVGYAIGDNQDEADKAALAKCRATAGASRQQFCTIPADNKGCDGVAK
jgi:Domain of unknown function (DUF4189)